MEAELFFRTEDLLLAMAGRYFDDDRSTGFFNLVRHTQVSNLIIDLVELRTVGHFEFCNWFGLQYSK